MDLKKAWDWNLHYTCGDYRKFYRYDRKAKLRRLIRDIKFTQHYSW